VWERVPIGKKRVGTPLPRVPTPLHPWRHQCW